jgi:hypothetical protein
VQSTGTSRLQEDPVRITPDMAMAIVRDRISVMYEVDRYDHNDRGLPFLTRTVHRTRLPHPSPGCGCPDCADGGAEWLEIDGKRVTLEFRSDLEPIRPLLQQVRALRARFELHR